MDYVYSPHNLSAIVRTADAVNIWKLYYRHQKKVKINKDIAMKADKWMEIEYIENIEKFYKQIKSEWYQVVVTLLGEDTIDFREVNYTKPTLIVLWNEVDGISEVSKLYADKKVSIPIYWMSQSLNVSVANAVMLYEAQRQRKIAWMYDKSSLPEKIIQQTLNKWLSY
jgi:tRNA (guanosine-2'-O-)-methyltransferase